MKQLSIDLRHSGHMPQCLLALCQYSAKILVSFFGNGGSGTQAQ